jgi:hypothetical protein
MDRPAPKPGNLRTDLPELSHPAEPEPEAAPAAPPQTRSNTLGWRIAMFLWLTAFGFLATFELVSLILKVLKIRQ